MAASEDLLHTGSGDTGRKASRTAMAPSQNVPVSVRHWGSYKMEAEHLLQNPSRGRCPQAGGEAGGSSSPNLP